MLFAGMNKKQLSTFTENDALSMFACNGPGKNIPHQPKARTYIQLVSGRYVDLLHPIEDDIHISDIAHGLSNLCRFTGHTSTFYSVAQHSVFVANYVPAHLRLTALLHDATEAYLGDISTPLKALLPEYKLIERQFEIIIAKRFNLPPFKSETIIKAADTLALFTEKRDLMPESTKDSTLFSLLSVAKLPKNRIVPLSPAQAKALFLEKFEAYSIWNTRYIAE